MIQKQKLLYYIVLPFILIVLIVQIYQKEINKFINYSIYSNQYHYIDCNKLPEYNDLVIKFNDQKETLIESIKDIENKFDLGKNKLEYSVGNGRLSGGYISIAISKVCENKGEVNVTVTSNTLIPKLKKILESSLNYPPINFIND